MEKVHTVVIGSGPSGVSATMRLLEGKATVAMIHPGKVAVLPAPPEHYLAFRQHSNKQQDIFIGKNFEALKAPPDGSPKRRVPGLHSLFSQYDKINRMKANDFLVLGALVEGGLSSTWGAGAALFDAKDLEAFPFSYEEIAPFYKSVTQRVGVSGPVDRKSARSLGFDIANIQPSLGIAGPSAKTLMRYKRQRGFDDFKINEAYNAVTTRTMGQRRPCEQSGDCLWGCERGAIYSSAYELDNLRRHSLFYEISPAICTSVEQENDRWRVVFQKKGSQSSISAKRVVLAAGTLASIRFALNILHYKTSVEVLHNPVAAFLFIRPMEIGTVPSYTFALAQLAFDLQLNDEYGTVAHGHMFNASNVLMSEMVTHVPFSRKNGISVMRNLHSACVLGNVYLPGTFSRSKAWLDQNDCLVLDGAFTEKALRTFGVIKRKMAIRGLRLGQILVPGGFQIAKPGADAHYAGGLSMGKRGQAMTSRYGELYGAEGIFIVDASTFSTLSSKPHTLTAMANAERIGKYLATERT